MILRPRPMVMLLAMLLAGGCGAQFSDEEALRAAAEELERTGMAEAFSGAEDAGPTVAAVPVSSSEEAGAAGTASSPAGEPAPVASVAGATASNPDAPSETPAPLEPEGVITSVEPRCVERPGTVTVSIRTGRLADIAYATSFSDGHHYDQWGLGQADLEGRYVWVLTVKPDVPDGIATAVVASSNVEGEGGSGQGQFRVAPAGGCRA